MTAQVRVESLDVVRQVIGVQVHCYSGQLLGQGIQWDGCVSRIIS